MTTTTETQTSQKQPKKQPQFRQFSDQMTRLQSFNAWPEASKKRPEQLSSAGFFYDQADNQVVCFSCGACNQDGWYMRDDPWKVHALKSDGVCNYLTMVKGSDYIRSVWNERRDKMMMTFRRRYKREQIRREQREQFKKDQKLLATVGKDYLFYGENEENKQIMKKNVSNS